MINLTQFTQLSSELEQFLSKKDNVQVLNKMLLIECNHNLNLIDCLKADLNQQSEEILDIIQFLEIDVLSIYLSDKIKHKTLAKKLVDTFTTKADTETDDLIANIILKIKILKSISELPFKEKSGYKKFRLKTRIKNLKSKLYYLKTELEKEV